MGRKYIVTVWVRVDGQLLQFEGAEYGNGPFSARCNYARRVLKQFEGKHAVVCG